MKVCIYLFDIGKGTIGFPWPFGDIDNVATQQLVIARAAEDRIIARALDLSGGNKKEAARLLHLNRTTLLEKLKRKRENGETRRGVPAESSEMPSLEEPQLFRGGGVSELA